MYQNAISICISWEAKSADFWWKNADVSRTHSMCHMIHIFFGSSLGGATVPSFIIVGYVWQILGMGAFLSPSPPPPSKSMSSPEKAHPEEG